MAQNDQRRRDLADAALKVLGTSGSRGLTHRAVDTHAAVPSGTAVNYFPTRVAIFEAMAHRIFDRIAPDAGVLADLADRAPDIDTLVAYTRYVVERLLAQPALALALVELRLEAARTPALAATLGAFFRQGLAADVAFNDERGLPGGPDDIVMLHHAIEGIVLDRLTTPLVPDDDPFDIAEQMTRRLLAPPAGSPPHHG